MVRRASLVALLLLVPLSGPFVPPAARGEIVLPARFKTQLYATGDGFDGGTDNARGLPSATTAAVDSAGVLYLARNGRRYFAGEVEDVFPIYRVPAGGARLTRASERQYLYGPPLPNAHLVLVNPGAPLATVAVFRARAVRPEGSRYAAPARWTEPPADAVALAGLLAKRGNDLTEAAIGLMPAIGDVLALLGQQPACLLARLSGSGATCFGLFASRGGDQRHHSDQALQQHRAVANGTDVAFLVDHLGCGAGGDERVES